ncbi:MAG: ComEC/Rec2 family competence protein [Bacteroidetes bacterium]|nr:ComEC/Rec2 family competence protein [Bacteroidota bacterium]
MSWLGAGIAGLFIPMVAWRRLVLPMMAGAALSGMVRLDANHPKFGPANSPASSCQLPDEDCAQTTVLAWVQPDFVPGIGPAADDSEHEVGPRGLSTLILPSGPVQVWMTFPNDSAALTNQWALVRLRRVQLSDWSSPFSWEAYLQTLGATHEGVILSTWDPSQSERRLLATAAWHWRNWLASWPGLRERAPLMLGIFAGDKTAMARKHRDAFSEVGLSHILAVSGYHVGLVSAVFLLLLRAQNRHWRKLSGLGVLLGWAYAVLCGLPHSALRASLMIGVGWFALVRGKQTSAWHAWGLAASWVALMDPHAPFQVGTQLSFTATASLIGMNKRGWWLVPLRAQWSTLPWTIRTFGQFPMAFWPVNTLVAPLLMVLGVLMALGVMGLPLARDGAVMMGEFMTRSVLALVDAGWGAINLRSLISGSGWVLAMAIWGILWMSLLDKHRRCLIRRCWLMTTAGVLVAFLVQSLATHHQSKELTCVRIRGSHAAWLCTDGHGAWWWGNDGETLEKSEAILHRLGINGPLETYKGALDDQTPTNTMGPIPMKEWTRRWDRWAPTCRCRTDVINSISANSSTPDQRILPIQECPQSAKSH